VVTGGVSTRWRHLWKNVPSFILTPRHISMKDKGPRSEQADRFAGVVRTVLCHHGSVGVNRLFRSHAVATPPSWTKLWSSQQSSSGWDIEPWLAHQQPLQRARRATLLLPPLAVRQRSSAKANAVRRWSHRGTAEEPRGPGTTNVS
jgi:hypothetical protein